MSVRKLSIVTICYRDLVGLKKTIESLRMQSCHEFEQWIVDGGSDDGTVEYLESLNVPWECNWISERDDGIYDAMNKGTTRASGEYVWYLNSGDVAADRHVVRDLLIELSKPGMEGIDLLYGKTYFESGVGRKIVGRPVGASDFLTSMPVSHPGMIFKRELVKKLGYSTSYRIISDWILVRSIFERGYKSAFVDRILAIFDIQGISSRNHWLDLQEKLRYEQSLQGRLRVLIFCGGRYALLWLAKKMGLYRYWQCLRYSST